MKEKEKQLKELADKTDNPALKKAIEDKLKQGDKTITK